MILDPVITVRGSLGEETDEYWFRSFHPILPAVLCVRSPSSSSKGVLPFEHGEAGEVRVGGLQHATILNGESGYMGISHKVGCCLPAHQHFAEDVPVALCGRDDPGAWLGQPTTDALDGLVRREWALENTCIGADANENIHNRPAEADWRRTRELRVPPFPGLLVTLAEAILGVEEDIGIDEYQRKSSVSAWASNSWILSRLYPVRRPMG